MLYILIIGIIIFFIYQIYNIKQQTLWCKLPITKIWNFSNTGIIQPNINIKKFLKKDIKFNWMFFNKECDHINTITKFLNKHFYKDFNTIFSTNLVKYYLNMPNKQYNFLKYDTKKSNIGLLDTKKLIGFINGRPISYIFNNTVFFGYYVDFLCIHSNYRKKNLAALLISKLISNCHSKKFNAHIFKKEQNPLSYFIKYLCKTNYYYLHLPIKKSNTYHPIEVANKNDLIMIYELYKKFAKKFQFYQIFELSEFKYYYLLNDNIQTYPIKVNNIIIGVVSYCVFFTSKKKCAEIILIIGNIDKYFSNILNLMKSNHIEIIYIPNIANNYFLIKKFSFRKGLKYYYYLFNVNFYPVLDSKNVFLYL